MTDTRLMGTLVMDDEGGITFPPEALLAAGWKAGDWLEFRETDDGIRVTKVTDPKETPTAIETP